MKKFGRTIGGAMLTLAVVFGLYTATSTTAQAQWRNDQYRRDRNDDRNDRDREWRRRRDRDNRQTNRDWNRDGRYRRDGYGNNDYYRRNPGYGNNGAYGNYGGYNNNYELQRGYQQGLQTGASDGQRGQSYSPQRSRYYRNASSQAFLQGFVRGYDQGYRQYAGYGNGRYQSGNSAWGNILGGILQP
jgi:hypothetical protein